MSDRYVVFGQIFIVDGTAVISTTGRKVADTNFTCAGAGNFTVWMANGTTGTVSGTNVQGTPVTLSAGTNTITTTDAVADGLIDITIGTAANWNTANTWAATSGGQCGASIPTSADNVYADANSFTAASQVLTVDATANCLALDFTGATNSPTLTGGAFALYLYGNLTFITGMTVTAGSMFIRSYGSGSITTAGRTMPPFYVSASGITVTLLDSFTSASGKAIVLDAGTFDTNGQTLSTSGFIMQGASVKVLTLGNTTWTTTSWSYSGSNLTVSSNTAIINCSGNFTGGGITTYYKVNLTGATSTVSGNNSFTELNLVAGSTQTITFTSGTTQTATTFTLSGSAGHVHTLQGSTSSSWYLTQKNGNKISIDYVNLSYCTVSPSNSYAGANSTDTAGNTGWRFTAPPSAPTARLVVV